MIEQKQHDWILNIMDNQHLSTADLREAGLSAENTSLQSEETYKRSKQILENPLFQDELGRFSDSKFHDFYQDALLTYNLLADDTALDKMRKQQMVYGVDDIFAPRDKRLSMAETVSHMRYANPDKTTTGLIRFGETEAPRWSREENAQTQKVLANPTEVYDENGEADWSKAVWHDSPNESYFTDFWDTRVLAQYTSDGEHTDPFTGEKVKHTKGELILNEDGNYFYENLDGRDIYGRQVLNKMNTLTVDGSWQNDYDFFDSDDLDQKSVGGTIMKNLALVGTMFIPYVGPWVAGISAATQLAGLSATLGKMFLGSDSPTLSAIEGWTKSVNRQNAKSQYSQENIWCWENFINLIGDVAGQLKEQRFIFDYAPAIIKGNRAIGWKKGLSQTKQSQWIEKRASELEDLYKTKLADISKAGKATPSTIQAFGVATANSKFTAGQELNKFLETYHHIGSVISKGYMTALTVGDTYGEAKYEAGATDEEAMWLTLGYAAAEAALLNSPIGEWILPELRAAGRKRKEIIRAFTKDIPEEHRLVKNAVKKYTKEDGAKYWFNKGKELASKVLNADSRGKVGEMIAGGAAEGVEEVSEELLADFSKACFNYVQEQRGKEGRLNAWENVSDRYLMSLLGGAMGGSFMSLDLKNIKPVSMTSEQAIQEAIWMFRNGKGADLYKTLDKETVATPYLKSETRELSNGTIVQEAATKKSESVDAELKKVIKTQLSTLENLVKSEGLKITDNEFLDKQTFNDIKLAGLQRSSVAAVFLQDFNTLTANMLSTKNRINDIYSRYGDSKDFSEADLQRITGLKSALAEYQKRKEQYLNGELAMDYVSKALMDLTPMISQYYIKPFFKDYAQYRAQIDFNKIPEEDLKKYREEFDNWNKKERKNTVSSLAPVYLAMARASRDFIHNFTAIYDKQRRNKSLQNLYKQQRALMTPVTGADLENPEQSFLLNTQEIDEETWVDRMKDIIQSDYERTAVSLLETKGSKEVIDKFNMVLKNNENLQEGDKEGEEKLRTEFNDVVLGEIAINLDNYYDQFLKTGAINPEIKSSLKNLLNVTGKHLHSLLETIESIKSAKEIVSNLNIFGGNFTENDLIEDLDPDDLLDADFDKYDLLPKLNRIATAINMPPVKTLKDIDNIKNALRTYVSNIYSKQAKLESATYSNTVEFLQDFINTNAEKAFDINELMDVVDRILIQESNDLSRANFESYIEQIKEAIATVGYAQGIVMGAISDQNASFDNPMGYNVTLNNVARKQHVQDWEELPEINSETAYIINQDLELIKNKLNNARNLYLVNQGKKFNMQDNVATNKDFIVYNRLKKFAVSLDDDDFKSKLENVLDNSKLLSKLAKDRDASKVGKDDRKAIRKEMVIIEDTLYDLFNSKPEVIEKLFNKHFDLIHGSSQLMNLETEIFEDRNFLWYLASRAAIKRSAFNNELRQVISHKIAPLPIQEEAVFQNMAEILNGDMMNKFMVAYNNAANKYWDSLPDDEKLALIKENKNLSEHAAKKEGLRNQNLLPKYTNIYLVEGIPGSGKSTAVNYYTAQLLNTFHKDILANVWLAHGDTTRAEKLAGDMDIKVAKLLDHNSLMKLIYSEYNEEREVNNQGKRVYDPKEWYRSDNGEILYSAKSDDVTDVPSLIVIDEISHYDEADLTLLDDFARKYGITIITSGDFDQSSAEATTKFEGVNTNISINRNMFKHSPKIGVSMRTTNSQMDKSINAYLAWDGESEMHTYYYEGETGLNGVKITDSTKGEDLEATINLMVSTLKDKEKIGLIYNDPNSEVLKLVNQKYKDKFKLFYGTSAQGLEGQYYIVDFQGNQKEGESVRKDFYTGKTRSGQGVLVTYNPFGNKVTSIKENTTTISPLPPNAIANYAKHTKEVLDEINSTDETIKVIPRKGTATKKVVTKEETEEVIPKPITPTPPAVVPTNVKWSDPNKVTTIEHEGKQYFTDGTQVVSENKIVDGDVKNKIIDIAKGYESTDKELTLPEETSRKTVVENTNKLNNTVSKVPKLPNILEDFTYLLHTHNTNEIGVDKEEVDVEGEKFNKVKFYDSDLDRYEDRIDSAHGLMKIYEKQWRKPQLGYDFYVNKIAQLRGYLFNIADKQQLISALSEVFDPEEENDSLQVKNVEFGLLSAPNVSKKNRENGQKWGNHQRLKKFGMLDKSIDERTINNTNPDEKASEINRKTINAIITLNNGKRVALPLFVLPNLEVYARNPKDAITAKLSELWENTKGNAYNFHTAILENEDLKKIPEIYNLAKLWLFTNGAYFKIDDDTWTPAKNLTNWGIQVNTEAESGSKLPFNGNDSFRPISDFIGLPGIHFSKQIYSAQKPVEDGNGNLVEFGHKGHAFVLITTDPTLDSDEAMIKQYEEQVIDPSKPKKVTLAYILPPKVSVKEYLKNLHSIIHAKDTGEKINIKKLGSHLTSYYIWNGLLPELKNSNSKLSQIVDESTREKIIDAITRLNELSSSQDRVNTVLASEQWTKVNTGKVQQRLYEHLNYTLASTFMNYPDGDINEEALDFIANLAEQNGVPHVFHSIKFQKAKPNEVTTVSVMQSDQDLEGNSLYSINGLPYSINAKIDSNLFSVGKEFNKIIESFVKKILPATTKIPREHTQDTFKYINNKKSDNSKVNETIIPLESNKYDLDEIIIEYKEDGVYINGNKSLYNEVTAKNYKFRDKKTIKDNLQRLIPSELHAYITDAVIDKIYDNQIDNFITDNFPDMFETFNRWEMMKIASLVNEAKNNMVAYVENNVFMLHKFSTKELQDIGLDNISISEEFEFDSAGVAEINLGKNNELIINAVTGEVKLRNTGSNSEPEESIYDEMGLEDGSPVMDLFNRIGYQQKFLDDNIYEYDRVSQLKGSQDFIKPLTEIYKKTKDEELKNLLNYLAQDPEYCTRIITPF